jgi:hypothetical protein
MTTLYKKVGRRYIAVAEYSPEMTERLPYGSHLLTVDKGTTAIKFNIDPALAPLVAAGCTLSEDMMAAMIGKKDDIYPPHDRKPRTKKQNAAWEKLKSAWNDFDKVMKSESSIPLIQGSMLDVIEHGVKMLELETHKMLEVPAVKHAYDQFMMVYKLTKDNANVRS